MDEVDAEIGRLQTRERAKRRMFLAGTGIAFTLLILVLAVMLSLDR